MPQFTTHIKENGVIYHTADSLHLPGLAHGFSTRAGGVSRGIYGQMNLGLRRGDDDETVFKNYRIFCDTLGITAENCALAKQVHRDDVKIVTDAHAGSGLLYPQDYEADALVTNVPDIPLVIFSADCIPTLYYDPVTRCIGAAHAGWRGTALGIAAKTIRTMQRIYGADPQNIRTAIGPGISKCCFETSEDVPAAMHKALGQEADAYISADGNGKYHVDLKGINAHFMKKTGILAKHIAISDACTACHTDLYWSHRIVGDGRGSLAAIICMK